MNTVTKGAWPLVVIRVTTWYWMVCTPRLISSRRRFFHDLRNFLLAGIDAQIGASRPRHALRIFSRLTSHEGGQVGQADALTAVLAGGHLGDDLGGNVAGGGEGMGLLNERAADDGAVLQHVVQS